MRSILDEIGGTPFERIGRGLPAPILARCEPLDPGGSVSANLGGIGAEPAAIPAGEPAAEQA